MKCVSYMVVLTLALLSFGFEPGPDGESFEQATGTESSGYEQPDIDYRDMDLFIEPGTIMDKDNPQNLDPWKRWRAITEVFHPGATVGGRFPHHDNE